MATRASPRTSTCSCVPEFEQAWARRVEASIDQVPVAFLSRTDLISNKRATARPQDLAHVAALEALGESDQPSIP